MTTGEGREIVNEAKATRGKGLEHQVPLEPEADSWLLLGFLGGDDGLAAVYVRLGQHDQHVFFQQVLPPQLQPERRSDDVRTSGG